MKKIRISTSVTKDLGKLPEPKVYLDEPPSAEEMAAWITVSEACDILNCTRMRIHQLAKRDKDKLGNFYLRMVKIHPRLTKVSKEDVLAYQTRKDKVCGD